ncbi:MAG TPA: Uma2 family endonuclease [Tepidisphaeraceae bacterium]|jgi:Uma2 family endonuclease
MTTIAKPITAEELFAMGDIGRCELVRGKIIKMAPAGADHGDVAGEIFRLIKNYVIDKRLGKCYAAETGFQIERDPDTVRAPDVAFVQAKRVPAGRISGFFPGAPDLAVEVVSPSDSHTDIIAKVDTWLAAGTISVWVVDPRNRIIEVYRAGNQVLRYRAGDELRDDPVLPGFVLKVEEVYSGR